MIPESTVAGRRDRRITNSGNLDSEYGDRGVAMVVVVVVVERVDYY